MLILASKSESRRAMLAAAGAAFEVRAAAVNERALEAELTGARPDQIVLALAEAKALAPAVAPDASDEEARRSGQDLPQSEAAGPVLGSDSLVVVGDRHFAKPESREEAAEHLRHFSGRVMQLHSAAAIARDGAIVWHHAALATLSVRQLSDDFIAAYLDAEWPAVAETVGVFRIEGRGVQLFERIEGDFFTILGMPLLPVLGALREMGELPA